MIQLPQFSRRDVIVSAGLAAALGISQRLAIVNPAYAQKTPDPAAGFKSYKVGDVEVKMTDFAGRVAPRPDFLDLAATDRGSVARTLPRAEISATLGADYPEYAD